MKRTVLAMLVAATALVTGCQVSTGSFSKQTPTVRIGRLNIVTGLPVLVAEQEGFLADEAIEYRTLAFGSSNEIVDAVLADRLDCFVGASAVPVLAAQLSSPGKLKVFAVSQITADKPFDALLVRCDSSIKTFADLPRAKVAVFPGSTAKNLLSKFLADEGVDVSSLTFVPMAPVNHLDALLEGVVDVIYAYEPTIAVALSSQSVRKLYGSVYAQMLSPNPISVSVISTEFLKKHPETARSLIRALERGMAYMKEDDSRARSILEKEMKLSRQAADRCVFLYMVGHERIDPALLQRFANILADSGELEEHVNVENLIYP
jgi:NitT/TauT family transport system substrate-binding protein